MDYGPSKRQFNSGVMLIKQKYISNEWFDRAIDLLHEKTHTSVQDQSLLNHLWRDENKLFLPHTYNWKVPPDLTDEVGEKAMSDARVVHFVGPVKFKLARMSENVLVAKFHELREAAGAPIRIGR
ncbi:glycosyltransferase (plasmid) [Rhizobium sp. 32-5/1]|uniref:glycosyltransferase n=1 Tax=Rhizobium sp. 32-5/1 TaxID=3019602 RepID=UPI00240D0E1F|nr:glycosyltransferase [Rhizobium sp. 32-5/1]WEZ86113.1 glycosyltransferase [Rhizobium sp. 32-5/1]